MLDVVEHSLAREFSTPLGSLQMDPGTAELALLARQTRALEYIASQLGVLTLRAGQPIELPAELQPDFEIARRRLLEEAI